MRVHVRVVSAGWTLLVVMMKSSGALMSSVSLRFRLLIPVPR